MPDRVRAVEGNAAAPSIVVAKRHDTKEPRHDMALIGYIRAASYDPTMSVQRQALDALSIEELHSDDDAAGERRGLQRCLSAAKPGDTIAVYGIDRLAHSTSGLLSFLDELARRRIHLLSISDHIDTRTHEGSALYRIVRLLLDAATRANEDKRKPLEIPASAVVLPGAKSGAARKGKPSQRSQELLELGLRLVAEPGASMAGIAKAMGIHRSNLYRAYPEIKAEFDRRRFRRDRDE